MPNARRRRFSVKQNAPATNDLVRNDSQSRTSNTIEHKSETGLQSNKPKKLKNNIYSPISTKSSRLGVVIECEKSLDPLLVKSVSADKNVMASSSNIDFYNILNMSNDHQVDKQEPRCLANQLVVADKKDTKSVPRRDKFPRQHRMKVRSPKRKSLTEEAKMENDSKLTKSLNTVDCDQEKEEQVVINNVDNANEALQIAAAMNMKKYVNNTHDNNLINLINQKHLTVLTNPTNQSNPFNQSNPTVPNNFITGSLSNSQSKPINKDNPITLSNAMNKSNPISQNNTTNQNNPTDQNNPTSQNNPTNQNNSTDQNNPTNQNNPTKQNNPTNQNNLTNQNNPTNQNNLTNQNNPTNQDNPTNQNNLTNQNNPTNQDNPTNQNTPINQSNTTNQNNFTVESNIVNPINPVNQSSPLGQKNQNHPSNNSFDVMCRICHGGDSLSLELGQMISACGCRGTVGRVHVKCLERWLTESGKSRCELCGTRYSTRRVHKYGFPKALAIWVLSQNAKQLMVDSLGIMLMSPLAVVAAWLSGRTLAGLMTPESQQTPWPLASTFVLACMTLVCYYCWIVSAVTRHALGWWIWYRSQYEVRLQLQDDQD